MNRRNFLAAASAAAGLALARPVLGAKAGTSTLRTRSAWIARSAARTWTGLPTRSTITTRGRLRNWKPRIIVEFHRTYNTDIVKVMNDFDYPKSETGKWHELEASGRSIPGSAHHAKIIRDGLNGTRTTSTPFTAVHDGDDPVQGAARVFRPRPKRRRPGPRCSMHPRLPAGSSGPVARCPGSHHAIDTESHSADQGDRRIGRAGGRLQCGSEFGTVADYERFSRPYDRRVFDALADSKLTFLHLHNLERPYIDQFKDLHAPVVQYSLKTSGIPVSEIRGQFSQTIAGGVDEVDYEKLTVAEIRKQWTEARSRRSQYIAAPGWLRFRTPQLPKSSSVFRWPWGYKNASRALSLRRLCPCRKVGTARNHAVRGLWPTQRKPLADFVACGARIRETLVQDEFAGDKPAERRLGQDFWVLSLSRPCRSAPRGRA